MKKMFTEKSETTFGQSPDEILVRCLQKNGFTEWNHWRDSNKKGHITLKGASLGNANLEGADLSQVDLRMADLKNANLSGADLSEDRRTFIWSCDFDEQTVFSLLCIDSRFIQFFGFLYGVS